MHSHPHLPHIEGVVVGHGEVIDLGVSLFGARLLKVGDQLKQKDQTPIAIQAINDAAGRHGTVRRRTVALGLCE